MKLHQIIRTVFPLYIFLGVASTVQAKDADSAKMLVYISPQEYTHSIKLWHYYYSYWFEQGPAVESVALELLSAEYGDVKMCEGNSTGNTLVWIKPRMYYNPQLGIFYGEVTASIYSGSGKPLGSYVGESRRRGFLDVYPALQVEAAYKVAMENLLIKIKADQALQTAINESVPADETKSPCTIVALLPQPKANDWGHYIRKIK